MAYTMQAFFLPPRAGQPHARFCVLHSAGAARPRGLVVYLHPLAEEMNKSRHVVAAQARALARGGYAVLQCDLTGCGDSGGEFSDATWLRWAEDAAEACRWLLDRFEAAHDPLPLWLWGLRAGCLIATAASPLVRHAHGFLFWQPSCSGTIALQQFLRLSSIGGRIGASGDSVAALRERLARGETVEVAGYGLAPALAQGLDAARLAPSSFGPTPSRVAWIEVSSAEPQQLAAASREWISRWRAAGHEVHTRLAGAPPFWQAVELEDAPALIDATCEALGLREPDAARTSPAGTFAA